MGNPEPNPFSENKKGGRCRDSMEAVLTNGVDYVALVKEWMNPSIETPEKMKDKRITYWNTIWLMTTRIYIFYIYIFIYFI